MAADFLGASFAKYAGLGPERRRGGEHFGWICCKTFRGQWGGVAANFSAVILGVEANFSGSLFAKHFGENEVAWR